MDYEYLPKRLKLEYRDLWIKTKDNYELNTWVREPFDFCKTREDANTIEYQGEHLSGIVMMG